MTVREAVDLIVSELEGRVEEAGLEARLMAAKLMGKEKLGFTELEAELPEGGLSALFSMAERRKTGEPLQYILGEWYFMGLPFIVSPAALIPRQDTETLCEEALDLIRLRGYRKMLDICTGTGCIAVSLAKLSGIEAEAADISSECAALAERNAKRNGVRIFARMADLFNGAGKFDLITANPPYITDEDMENLQREVSFEPRLALAGGPDGLTLYRRIAREAAAHMNEGGALLMEVGYGEAEKVRALFPENVGEIIPDLNGIPRVVRIDF